MEVEDGEGELEDGAPLPAGDDVDDAPAAAGGLGAVGQLVVAVIAVALLLAAFIGGSALLRRILG
jgi:hypothetical protein